MQGDEFDDEANKFAENHTGRSNSKDSTHSHYSRLLDDDDRVRTSFVVSKEARLQDDAQSVNERNDAVEYEHANTAERIARRVMALFLTFAIEMMPALIISDGEWFERPSSISPHPPPLLPPLPFKALTHCLDKLEQAARCSRR